MGRVGLPILRYVDAIVIARIGRVVGIGLLDPLVDNSRAFIRMEKAVSGFKVSSGVVSIISGSSRANYERCSFICRRAAGVAARPAETVEPRA